MDNIFTLHTGLNHHTYRHGPYQAFAIHDPKPRSIHKASVRDRLLHHAIYRILYPFFDRTFIADSYSCRLRRGTHKAFNRFHEFGRTVGKNGTRTCWVLKCDIRKFFASVDHPVLRNILRTYIPSAEILRLLGQIISGFHSAEPGKGLPLGNLTSQLFVNIYMNEFDQYVKHRLQAKHYIRYADDFVILSQDRGWLETLIPKIAAFLKNRLELELHPHKVSIGTFASGVDFLGWVHFSDHRVLRTTTKRRMLTRLGVSASLAAFSSYLGLLGHGNAHTLRRDHRFVYLYYKFVIRKARMDIHPIDLQVQTTASDGKHSPAECVRMAKQNGVHVMAITDHDTVAGVAEATAAGQALGVRIIAGVEISIAEPSMHLLGLGIDPAHIPLCTALNQAAENRVAAAKQMVEKFRQGGFAVDWVDVAAEAGSAAVVARPHIVGAIMKRPENAAKLEGITTKHEFFQKYFGDDSPYYVRASSLAPADAIVLIHGAGGIAVWSHPPIPGLVGQCAALEERLSMLRGFGLDGLELFGPFLTEADFHCLEGLVDRYHLLATAGSDFHEALPLTEALWPRSATTIGDYPTYGRSLAGIIPALDAVLARRRIAFSP